MRNAPAPWVPFARAGCDVGNVSVANTVLENNTASIFRGGPTALSTAAAAGATNIKVASTAGFLAGNTITIDTGTNAETIGDELSAANIDWAWYSGGWANADGETSSPYYTNGPGPDCSDPNVLPSANMNHTYPYCPDGLFQFHHQAFNYFASFVPGRRTGRTCRTRRRSSPWRTARTARRAT